MKYIRPSPRNTTGILNSFRYDKVNHCIFFFIYDVCVSLHETSHSVLTNHTHVFLKSPPRLLPTNRKNCWEKKTQVICCRVDWV